jgi:hypothetical protein
VFSLTAVFVISQYWKVSTRKLGSGIDPGRRLLTRTSCRCWPSRWISPVGRRCSCFTNECDAMRLCASLISIILLRDVPPLVRHRVLTRGVAPSSCSQTQPLFSNPESEFTHDADVFYPEAPSRSLARERQTTRGPVREIKLFRLKAEEPRLVGGDARLPEAVADTLSCLTWSIEGPDKDRGPNTFQAKREVREPLLRT